MKRKVLMAACVVFPLVILAGCGEKQTINTVPTEKPMITESVEPTEVLVNEPIHMHSWQEATCKQPRICTECGMTEGTVTKHIWREATCIEPKTCILCFATEGELLEHEWIESDYVEPTCADGKRVYTCACGNTKEEVVEAIESHICDKNGVCIACEHRLDVSKMVLEEILIENVNAVERCGVFRSEESKFKIYKPIMTEDIHLPIVELSGDLSTVTKYEKATVGFSYEDAKVSFTCYAQINVQGASSVRYPKKNYSIKLMDEEGKKNKIELVDGWGKQHKYCMKANYIDFSQARNVVSGKLWGDVVKSRECSDELSELINGGAIDGYPILVYNNGEYLGLYTMNIPKDKWLLGMKDSDEKTQAILMAIDWTDTTAIRKPMEYISGSGMELEFYSNEESKTDNSTAWVKNSFNEMISFVMNHDGEEFLNGISQYVDVEKCIDSMLYTYVICATDNVSKNILWVTFDGTVWYSSVYDMDGSWGLRWDGQLAYTENSLNITKMKSNLLWEKLYKYDFERIAKRYWELREGPLSMENITAKFDSFFAEIPQMAYNAEKQKWMEVPSQSRNTKDQILDFAKRRIEVLDGVFFMQDEEEHSGSTGIN